MVVSAIVGRCRSELVGKAGREIVAGQGCFMSLVGQRDDTSYAGCANARPTNLEPALLALVSRRVVDRDACIWISIPGDVRCATFAAAIIHVGGSAAVADLIAWLSLIVTAPSPSPPPSLLPPALASCADST